jgi:signal transduction histidine kinase
VLKHANATQINIQLSLVQQQINLLFEDNGIGFDVSSKINGIGLMNINARVKNINGTISIEGGLKKGTKITINSTL